MDRFNPTLFAGQIPPLLGALRAAGEILLRHQSDLASLVVHDKSEGRGTMDLVSEADHAVDRLLRERLARIDPVPYWSEESGERPGQDDFWLVDPLDGTNNFLAGLPLYGIAVARMQAGRAVAAASYFPGLGSVAYAIRDVGAWLDGRRLELAARPTPSWIVEVNTQPTDADQIRNLTTMVREVRAVRMLGSLALSLVWVAAGRLDLFIGRGHPWDVAGGMLVLEEAGGCSRLAGADRPRDPLMRELMLSGHPETVLQARGRILEGA